MGELTAAIRDGRIDNRCGVILRYQGSTEGAQATAVAARAIARRYTCS
jgi:hypothetical protein